MEVGLFLESSERSCLSLQLGFSGKCLCHLIPTLPLSGLGKAPAELSFSIWTLGIIAKPLSLTKCFQIPGERPHGIAELDFGVFGDSLDAKYKPCPGK